MVAEATAAVPFTAVPGSATYATVYSAYATYASVDSGSAFARGNVLEGGRSRRKVPLHRQLQLRLCQHRRRRQRVAFQRERVQLSPPRRLEGRRKLRRLHQGRPLRPHSRVRRRVEVARDSLTRPTRRTTPSAAPPTKTSARWATFRAARARSPWAAPRSHPSTFRPSRPTSS